MKKIPKIVQDKVCGMTSIKIIGAFNEYNDKTIAMAKRAIGRDQKNIVIDLRETSFLTSQALAMMIIVLKHIRLAGGKMFVLGPTQDMTKLFKLVHLDRVFTIAESEAELQKQALGEQIESGEA